MPTRCWRRRSACRKSSSAKCARASKRMTASRRRSMGRGPITRAFVPAANAASTCRKPREGGAETVLIDGDARAEGKAFFHLAGARHSPDHSKLAWSSDDLGSEMLTIAVRDLERETDLADRVVGATGDIVWSAGFPGLSLRRAGREPPPVPGDAASPRDRADRRFRDLRGSRSRPGSSALSRRVSAARPLSRCTATTLRKPWSLTSIIRRLRPGSSRRAARDCTTT